MYMLGKRDGQQVATATMLTNVKSRLFFVTDKFTRKQFLVDTGAEVSVIPPDMTGPPLQPTSIALEAANHSKIKTYGTTLCLPGQFFDASLRSSVNPTSDLVCKLKQTMQKLQATPTKLHTRTTYVSKKLDTCTHVFVRQDHVQKPLDMPYKGPYRVIRRARKYFVLDLDGRQDTVSLDRLKPAFMNHSRDDRDDPVPDDADPELKDPESAEPANTESLKIPLMPRRTRSGRTVQTPKRYET